VTRTSESKAFSPYAFDPVAVGRSECAAWAAYYRRDWSGVLRGAVGMVRHGFGLGALTSLRGAWHVLRANQEWAPNDNRPAEARRQMAAFYRLADRAGRLSVDPTRAADLEVRWWKAHREQQHGRQLGADDLLDALVALYAYVYHAEPDAVRPAAERRVRAMQLSDAWVATGCHLEDRTLAQERLALVASYTALREASDRGALQQVPTPEQPS
jgi:hypothetical protein